MKIHQAPPCSVVVATLLGTMGATASSFLMAPPASIVTSPVSTSVITTASNNRHIHARTALRNVLTVPLRGGNQRGNLKTRVRAATDAADGEQSTSTNEQTIATATFNLIKGCMGAGVLSLPAGVAAIGDVPKAMIPACAIFVTLGTISAYTFHLIGRLVQVANSESSESRSEAKVTSLGQLWDKEIGESTSWLITLACFLVCYGTCLAYSIVLGDSFRSLAESAGLKGIMASRRANVAAITLFGVYPLCTLKSLAALKPVSIIGNIGLLTTALVMTLRALPGGAYSTASSAANYLATLPPALHPSFGVIGLRKLGSTLVLSSMAATAFLVHMAAPEFYQTLEERSIKRFGMLSTLGFSSVVALSAYMMCVGFLTFGGSCKGMILNNYSTLDPGATLCRFLMGVALLGSYAFIGNVMKSSFNQLFYKGKEITDEIQIKTTQALVGTIASLALVLNDAGFVVSFTGALLGSALIYIIPPLLFLKSTTRRIGNGSLASTLTLKVERVWNRFLIVLGAFLALAGGWMTVVNCFFPHLL